MPFQTLDLLLALGLGLAIGWTGGDETRRRKSAEQQLLSLRDQLQLSHHDTQPLLRLLKQQRGILNDIHKRIITVTKGLQKQAR
jgi:hypothetical protein